MRDFITIKGPNKTPSQTREITSDYDIINGNWEIYLISIYSLQGKAFQDRSVKASFAQHTDN
jgi:hypothetical protein